MYNNLGTTGTNYDYNDNMFFITNVKPETGAAYFSALSATPSALDFGEKLLQNKKYRGKHWRTCLEGY